MRKPRNELNKKARKVDKRLAMVQNDCWSYDVYDGIGNTKAFDSSCGIDRFNPYGANKAYKYRRSYRRF